jgi:hypothetical protein
MSKPTATIAPWVPKTFVPSRIQYAEAGINWRWLNGDPIKIMPDGVKAPTKEDEDLLVATIKRDPMCGICEFGKHEVPPAARKEVDKNVALQAENDQLRAELETYRELLNKQTGG